MSIVFFFNTSLADLIGNKYQIRFQPNEDLFAGDVDGTDEIHTIEDTGLDTFLDQTEFIFRRGLCNDDEYVSIESAIWPGMFWRHQNYIVKLHDKKDDDLFQQDSCWKIVKELCGVNSISNSEYI